ncbi:DUF6776 family protein [Acinetobacter stercoris]|uniref:Uncharacterized protein n=1 Tax=Acinetobacter stercoris TaxID=2126983 RepID=A0A2U3MUC6_9GAMM|nr:DUF6776 family protein [Acinetobacter stercoris]SPL69026.1 hypothetical protein KPC_0204 [Acinetobacter stercoris]
MYNSETNDSTNSAQLNKKPFMRGNSPLAIGGVVLCVGSLLIGYTVGHRQGLSVVGYDADAQQLVDVVDKQKVAISAMNKSLNATVQERDVAVTNSNDLLEKLNSTKAEKDQYLSQALMYREILRLRGGLSLTVQNLAIKPLPENAFEYQIDLLQVSPAHRRVSGTVELRLISGTEVLTVPLEDNKYNFEDYARLTGRWTMPKGFNPQFIEVRLNGGTSVIRRFSWSRGKPVESSTSIISEIPQAEANAQ